MKSCIDAVTNGHFKAPGISNGPAAISDYMDIRPIIFKYGRGVNAK
jgi:hypothetical protein